MELCSDRSSNRESRNLLNCVVVLDKKEYEFAASKYLIEKNSETVYMDATSDTDDDRLEIDESTPPEVRSMPTIDLDGERAKTMNKGVVVEWASNNHPMYGSAQFVPKEKKKYKRKPQKVFVDAGSQYKKEDVQPYCQECITGKLLKKITLAAKVDVELSKFGTNLHQLTNGKKVTRDIIEKIRKLTKNRPKPQVQVSSMQVKRITKTKPALPQLLPLTSIQQEPSSSMADENQFYTEEIQLSRIQCMPLNFMDPFDQYQQFTNQFFSNEPVSSTTQPTYEPSFPQPNHTPNFYVNTMDSEPSSTDDETQLVIDEKLSDTETNDDEAPKEQDPENKNETTPEQNSEPQEPEKDMFEIDDADKEAVELNAAAGEVELFPDMTPTAEKTPSGQIFSTDYDDAINLHADDDFGKEFEEPEPVPQVKANKSIERQSILNDINENQTNRPRRNRFKKIGDQDEELSAQPSTSHGIKRPLSPVRNNHGGRNKRAKRDDNRAPCALPWADQDDTISPFKNNLFPQPQQAFCQGSCLASNQLFVEFGRICRNKLYGECMGGPNCNHNHEFPTEARVAHLLEQMPIQDIQKFIASVYKSIPCSLIYFPTLSNYFGHRKMKHNLVEAIPMAEGNILLLQNYKWIVHGLIQAKVQTPNAIRTLLDQRKNFSAQANRVIVEIIVKTNMESQFLETLIEFSETTVKIYTLDMFHKFMMNAMSDPNQINAWEILIGNILDSLTQEGMNEHFDEKLVANFITWLNVQKAVE